tara:strand:+ start:262 stop:1017 length:756 start_codon:yes stop_codon:yes gene_type:complete
MAFKLKNTPDKMFHQAAGKVKQPGLPGIEADGNYMENPEAPAKGLLTGALAAYGTYKAGKAVYNKGKEVVGKVKQAYSDYQTGKATREASANTDNTDSKKTETKKTGGSGKITGKLGSDTRKAEYDAKGWKYDHTISGDHEGSYKSKTSGGSKSGTATVEKETVTPKSPKTKVGAAIEKVVQAKKVGDATRKSTKADKKQKQADEALASGNTRKAARKQAAADRKNKKAKKKLSGMSVDLSGSGVGQRKYK